MNRRDDPERFCKACRWPDTGYLHNVCCPDYDEHQGDDE